MTEQIGDIFIRRGKRYEGNRYNSLYFPLDCVDTFKIKTRPWSSNCWRGYVAEYDISNNEMILKNLDISGLKPFPKINNSKPKYIKNTIFSRTKSVRYENINMKIPFTGEIYLNRELTGPINKLMFNARQAECNIILEFVNGNLINEIYNLNPYLSK